MKNNSDYTIQVYEKFQGMLWIVGFVELNLHENSNLKIVIIYMVPPGAVSKSPS